MSSLYDQLASEKKKFEKTSPLLHTVPPEPMNQPRLLGVKIGSVFALIFSLTALASAAYLYQSLNGERSQREALQASMIQVQEKTETMRSESTQYQSEIERLQTQLRESARERAEMKRGLEQARTETLKLQGKIKELEKQNQNLKEELKARVIPPPVETAPIETVPAEVSAAGQTAVPKPAPVLFSGEAAFLAPVAAPSTPVSATPTQALTTKIQKVMTVNRKFNFAVLNLGIRDGLKMGDQLSVQHEGKTIGSLQVEKLYEDFAAATIMDENKRDPIKEGDLVLKS